MYPGNTGWVFVDPTGTSLTGGSREDLIARVRRFRELNQLPPGDPEGEVDAHICRYNAKICDGMVPVYGAGRPAGQAQSLSKRVLAWLGRFAGQARQRVTSGEAQHRVTRCSACPHALAYSISCGGCHAGTLAIRTELLKGTPPEARQAPGGCAHYGWDNAVAVGYTHPADSAAPPTCWRSSG